MTFPQTAKLQVCNHVVSLNQSEELRGQDTVDHFDDTVEEFDLLDLGFPGFFERGFDRTGGVQK
jgi:hypothetical protein